MLCAGGFECNEERSATVFLVVDESDNPVFECNEERSATVSLFVSALFQHCFSTILTPFLHTLAF